MRIVHVIPTLNQGGAEKFVVNLAIEQKKRGNDVMIICFYASTESNNEKQLKSKEVRIVHLNKKIGIDFLIYLKILWIVISHRPHIMHTHLSVTRYTFCAMFLAKRNIHTIHNTALKEVEPVGRYFHFIALKMGLIPVAISGDVKESFEKLYRVRIKHVIFNGIELQRFHRNISDLKKASNVRFISIARLEEQKNLQLMIDSAKILSNSGYEFSLSIAGNGSQAETLSRYIVENNLSKYITLLGNQDDVPTLLFNSDIFLLSSKWEGMPIAAIEALAAGLPIISTNVGGMRELVFDGSNGFLVETFDSQEYARCMERFLKNGELIEKFGKVSLKVAETFDIVKVAEMYDIVYRDIDNGRST